MPKIIDNMNSYIKQEYAENISQYLVSCGILTWHNKYLNCIFSLSELLFIALGTYVFVTTLLVYNKYYF